MKKQIAILVVFLGLTVVFGILLVGSVKSGIKNIGEANDEVSKAHADVVKAQQELDVAQQELDDWYAECVQGFGEAACDEVLAE